MANLSVSGTITATDIGRVATTDAAYNFGNITKIFDSTNVSSTGQQPLGYRSGSSGPTWTFSEFRILVFCQFTTDIGWKVATVPKSKWVSSTSENYVILNQSIDDTGRRIHIQYVNDTTFNIGYVQRTNRLVIYGIV